MKRILLFGFVVALLLGLCCGAAMADAAPWSGTGEENDPWIIATADDLVALQKYLAERGFTWGKYFLVTADIDLSEKCGPGKGDWIPMGDYNSGYRLNGVFDGGGHTISGLYIEGDGDFHGLFGSTWSECTIQNVTVEGTIRGHDWVGGIAGHSAGLIRNCRFIGSVSAHAGVGGIAGEMRNSRLHANNVNYGTISGEYAVGGITGHCDTRSVLINCVNYGSVTADDTDAGGIAGYAQSPVRSSENHGMIKGYRNVGGVVGYSTSEITGCKNDGIVIGETNYGSIVGNLTTDIVLTLYPNGAPGNPTTYHVYSSPFYAPECFFTHENLDFFAWNTEADGSGDWYRAGEELPFSTSLPLYAQWMSFRDEAYVNEDGQQQAAEHAAILRDDTECLPSGWYTLDGTVNMTERLKVRGDVKLILPAGAALNCGAGIQVLPGDSLTVYGCGEGAASGTLCAAGGRFNAGIGGNGTDGQRECGTVIVNGGSVVAEGGDYGAGIGGGDEGMGGMVIVNGGTVTATGRNGSAGIGGGDYAAGGIVIVNGGEVTAVGSRRTSTGQTSAGIGAGRPETNDGYALSGGSCTINGGIVHARSGGTDEGIGAQAIGTNYWSYAAGSDLGGTLNLADGMCVIPDGAEEPVLSEHRVRACRSGEVLVEACTGHRFGALRCALCNQENSLHAFFSGEGVSGNPYLIQNAEDWDLLCTLVNDEGYWTKGVLFWLTNDIEVSTPLGTEDHPFSGRFYGHSQTMTLRLNAAGNEDRYVAPFRWISGARITSLKTTGTVNGGRHSAGLVGAAKGTGNEISGCAVDVDIANAYLYAGGILGHGHSSGTRIDSSVFTGSLSFSRLRAAGTIWGWSEGDAAAVVENCLDASDSPYPMVQSYQTLSADSRVTNCYYLNPDKNNSSSYAVIPCRRAYSVRIGEGVTADFSLDGTTFSSDLTGLTVYPSVVGLDYNGVFCAGEGEIVSVRLNRTGQPGMIFLGYTVDRGALTPDGEAWSLLLPAGDVTVSLMLAPPFGAPDFTLPAALTQIGEEAFAGAAMTAAELPTSCERIGARAFKDCAGLKRIHIPAGVTEIDTTAFEGCQNVFVYGASPSAAQAFCETHGNCTFVPENAVPDPVPS